MEKIIASDSSILDSEYFFPKRSEINTTGKRLNLLANYYRFEFLEKEKKTFYKYSVNFEPEIPGDSYRLRARIITKAKDSISIFLGHHIFNNSTLYSLINFSELVEVSVELFNVVYKVKIKVATMIETTSFEAESLYKKFFGVLLKKLNFIQFRKNFYNKNLAHQFQNYRDIEVWPGFNSSVNILQEGILLNMNLTYRVIRTETALTSIESLLRNKNGEEAANLIIEKFKGTSVMTRYNGDKIYVVEDVDFKLNPTSTFDTKDGPVAYIDYYKTRYGLKITRLDQPLLVHRDKRKNQVIHLIPEFCYLSGLTEEMRANFNMMKEVNAITKGQAGEKLEECKNIIKDFLNNGDCQKEMKNWGMTVSSQPLKLDGYRLPAGNCVMHKNQDGSRYNFPFDDNPEVDRKIQAEMYTQPGLSTWAIFATEKDSGLANIFADTMKQVQSTFNYSMNKPAVFLVRSQNFRDWEAELAKNLNQNVQAVVLIIPGNRGKGLLYNDLKRLLMSKYPLPSQVVLSGTLAKGKGIRSIVNKVLIQICAKIGGEPWAVDQMPFTNCPTMICGMDMFSSTGKKSILGFTATYNRTFTRYISIPKVLEQGAESQIIAECIEEAVKNFGAVNKTTPQHIIVIRDGPSPSQIKSICIPEINSLNSALSALGLNCKLTYVLLNKKTNLKLFLTEGNSVNNSPPGTIVDTKVSSSEFNDFYLISAKSTQGLASCIHYQIIYDNAKVQEKDFHSLMYKLCYLYYNWTGAIKVPAPCQYAKKLATLLGDKLSDRKNVFLPHSRFTQQLKSLYYL